MKNWVVVALASTFFGGAFAYVKDASAWWTRQYGGVLSTEKVGDRVFGPAVEYPVLATSSMRLEDARTINVELFNLRSDSVTSAQICAAHWDGGGESCSPIQTATGKGHKSLDFASYAATWDLQADFAYVYVTTYNKAYAAAETARVNGIYITN